MKLSQIFYYLSGFIIIQGLIFAYYGADIGYLGLPVGSMGIVFWLAMTLSGEWDV